MKVTVFCTISIGAACLRLAMAQQPNFIVVQPDDFQFYEEFTPPAHTLSGREYSYPSYENPLPNIEKLKSEGVQMMQAYTASSMCGTSRYSTITGRYPSRSSNSRKRERGIGDNGIADIDIPKTKLEDTRVGRNVNLPDLNDCSHNNIAALLQKNGYKTGVTGKWHLKSTDESTWDYNQYLADVAGCGFDMAKGLYAENLGGFWTDYGAFSHNMEYITDYAVKFIEEYQSDPFFLYFNPTVPHASGSVYEALTNYTCLHTPEGDAYDTEPVIPGMTAEAGSCHAYRQTVLQRASQAGGATNRDILGAIWLDDAMGALIQALNRTHQLDNTFLLFQLDHGQEAKGTLWESGIRIAQFIHYPNGNFGGQEFPGLVSTIDIAPTILDYAGLTAGTAATGSWYEMDGTSWKTAVAENDAMAGTETLQFRNERCLFFEMDTDRGVRCGCDKFLLLDDRTATSSTSISRSLQHFGEVTDAEALMDICDGTGMSVASPAANIEALRLNDSVRKAQLKALVESHLAKTHPNLATMDFTELVDPAL